MSVLRFASPGPTGPDSSPMTRELEEMHASVEEQLRRVGVELPDATITSLAAVILADAVRISLMWLDDG